MSNDNLFKRALKDTGRRTVVVGIGQFGKRVRLPRPIVFRVERVAPAHDSRDPGRGTFYAVY